MTREQIERISKWVAALRSGKYQQAQHALRMDGGYCCMGVGCEVYRLDTGIGEWDYSTFYTPSGFSYAELPPSVADYYGLPGNPMLGDFSASQWNDERGADFAKIGDLIEAQYLTEVTA